MTLLWILGGIAWLGFGLVTVSKDMRDYPNPVVPGVDEAFRVLMALMGPLGLLIALIVREDIRRWK